MPPQVCAARGPRASKLFQDVYLRSLTRARANDCDPKHEEKSVR